MSGPRYANSLEEMPSISDMAELSGLEFMRGVLSGEVPGPNIGKALNYRLKTVEDGEVTFEGQPSFDVLNPMGAVHGGWYGTLLDSCMACAVQTKLAKGQGYTTQEYKVNLIRPLFAKSGAVVARGWVQHIGRRTAVAIGEMRGVEDNKLYATGSTTCLIMDLKSA